MMHCEGEIGIYDLTTALMNFVYVDYQGLNGASYGTSIGEGLYLNGTEMIG